MDYKHSHKTTVYINSTSNTLEFLLKCEERRTGNEIREKKRRGKTHRGPLKDQKKSYAESGSTVNPTLCTWSLKRKPAKTMIHFYNNYVPRWTYIPEKVKKYLRWNINCGCFCILLEWDSTLIFFFCVYFVFFCVYFGLSTMDIHSFF